MILRHCFASYQSTVLIPRYMYISHTLYSEEVHQSEVQFNDVHSCCCPHLFVFDKVDLINLIRIWWPLVCVHMRLSTVYFGPGFVENSYFFVDNTKWLYLGKMFVFQTLKGYYYNHILNSTNIATKDYCH